MGPGLELLLRALLGDLWLHWFPAGLADASAVIPRQAALVLHQALDRLKARYVQLDGVQTAAASKYAMLADAHKRRRISVEGIADCIAAAASDPLGR